MESLVLPAGSLTSADGATRDLDKTFATLQKALFATRI